jgi:transglutaminase-like putative cysteine protease
VTRRTVLAVTILVLWAGMVGWHVRREYLQPEMTRLAMATMTLAPGTSFYSLQMGGQAIGIASSQLDTIPEGFLLNDIMNLELQAMGQEGRAVVRTRVVLSPTLQMKEFAFALESGVGTFVADGTVEGDSLLRVRVESGGSPEDLTFRLPEAPLFAAALPIRIAKGGLLQVGRTHRFSVFDPSTVSTRTVEVEILEEDSLLLPDSAIVDPATGRWVAADYSQVPAWKIRESYAGITVESWVDQDGRVIRSSSPMGFSMERTAFELADQAQRDGREMAARGDFSGDLILSTAIASNVRLDDLEATDELRFVLSGVDLAGFDLDGGRQELRGDTLIVRREHWDGLDPGYSLPYPRMDLRSALEPEPLIQSGDERIQSQARRVVRWSIRGRNDPRTAALRLNQWVYESLRKDISFSIPSATQILETRQGDCNEHTVLYVALARALGLPARIAVGLVYLEGSFFYHAWPEVWLGEWVAVDPTFGQVPAGAAHLRFVTGGLAQQVEVARLIGNLRIEVVQ